MRKVQLAAAAALLVFMAASPARAEVQLSIRNGRVTLIAKDATVRQILAEWARVGQTKIVNAERVPGPPLTLQLTDMPEQQALDLLLRNVSGYLAAPRATSVADLSRYDRILVMPTAAAPRQSVAAAAPVFQQQPQTFVPAQTDAADDDRAAATVVAPPRGPVFTTFQQPQVTGIPPQGATFQQTPAVPGQVNPVVTGNPGLPPATGDQAAPPSFPNATVPTAGTGIIGSPRPGMVVPVNPQPGAPAQAPAGQ